MNPNSAHQLWSRWTTTVTMPFHPTHATPAFEQDMRTITARFYRQRFGSASELHLSAAYLKAEQATRFVVICRTEGAAVPDRVFRHRRMRELSRFFADHLRQYGRVRVQVDVHVEAGDVGDGKPPAQLIIGPPVALLPRPTLLGR